MYGFAIYRPPIVGFAGDPAQLGICGYDGGRAFAQLLEQRRLLQQEEQGLIAAAEAAGGSFSDAAHKRLGAIHAQFDLNKPDSLAAQIAQQEARKERDRRGPAADNASDPWAPASAGSSGDAPLPFRSLGEQLVAVAQAAADAKLGRAADQRLQIVDNWSRMNATGPSGGSESTGADGGFTVQKDFSNELLTNVWATGQLAKRARHVPIGAGSNGLIANVIDETSRATGSRWGAVQGYWLPEAGLLTGSRPKFRRLEIQLSKLICLYYATDELVQDALALGDVATEAFSEEMGFLLDDALIRGTGAGIPLGILNSPARVTVAKESGQSAATIVAENIEKMYARMLPGSLDTSAWFINQEVWPQLFGLYIPVGTGGVPLFVPASGGLVAGPAGYILGRPVVPIEQASALGTEGDIIFADFGDYVLADKGGIQAASSIHVLFLTDEMTFRWTLRTNGQPKRVLPITPYKGSATLSSFVTLAAR